MSAPWTMPCPNCIALHCIALHCITLLCIALHCIALHCIALHCIALQPFSEKRNHLIGVAPGSFYEVMGVVGSLRPSPWALKRPRHRQDTAKTPPRHPQDRPRHPKTPQIVQNEPKMVPKWSTMIQKRSQNGPKMVPKWLQHGPRMIPI